MATDVAVTAGPILAEAPRLVVEGIRKVFSKTVAVDGVDLRPSDGEFVTILGPSGCGKTTLLRMIAGFETPDAGEVRIGGQVVSDGDRGIRVPAERRNIGMVFQTYAVWPHLTVAQNVGYPLRLRRVARADLRRRVAEALELVSLTGLEERLPKQLSGGQQQRVALARAIVAEPTLLLLDEPLSNLDAKLRERMRHDLRRIQTELGITTLLVTHDQAEAMELSDRILVMRDGRLEQEGAPEELYHRPANAFVADFLGTANLLPGASEPGGWRAEDGPLLAVGSPPPAGARVAVVRPEDLALTPDGQAGEVLVRTFSGSRVTALIRWGKHELLAQVRPDLALQPGDRVDLRATRAHYLGHEGSSADAPIGLTSGHTSRGEAEG